MKEHHPSPSSNNCLKSLCNWVYLIKSCLRLQILSNTPIGELQRSAFISCQDPAQVQIKKLRPSLCSAHTSLCSPSSGSKMAQLASANWTAVWTRACQRVKVTESFVDAISLQPLPCLHFRACEPCFHLQDMFPLTQKTSAVCYCGSGTVKVLLHQSSHVDCKPIKAKPQKAKQKANCCAFQTGIAN